jgi:hypothetical protein
MKITLIILLLCSCCDAKPKQIEKPKVESKTKKPTLPPECSVLGEDGGIRKVPCK